MKRLSLMDSNDDITVNSLHFPITYIEQANSPEVIYHLWNNKGGVCDWLVDDIELSLLNDLQTISGGSLLQGQEVIDNNLVEVKSSGVIGDGIVDDNTDYMPIGKAVYASIGSIPTNCARVLYFRLVTNENILSNNVYFFLKIKYNCFRRKVYNYSNFTGKHIFLGSFMGSKLL